MDTQHSTDTQYDLVRVAHKGQVDKNGCDYFETHLLPVARSVPANLFYAALAHDILEDTESTVNDLSDAGFSEFEIQLIQLLTKTGDDYSDYLDRIAANHNARIIKVMDIANNLSRMHALDYRTAARLINKYLEALTRLFPVPEER